MHGTGTALGSLHGNTQLEASMVNPRPDTEPTTLPDETNPGPVPPMNPNPVPPEPGREPIPDPQRPGDNPAMPPPRNPFPDQLPGGDEKLPKSL
jgi:hypothetical protein